MTNPPREVKFSTLFFKSLSGLVAGIAGMVVLLIFVMLGLGTVGEGELHGPFLIFSAVAMGFITAIISNCLGVTFFDLIDREKYAEVRVVLKHVVLLNILIFIFLMPIHFFGIIASSSIKTVFLISTLQLVISSMASMFVLELSKIKSMRDNLLAIYGIVFALLTTVVVNFVLYQVGQQLSSPAELTMGGSGGKGFTMILFAILPVTWFFFGIFTTAAEMIYRWVYQTWGLDSLNKMENE